MKLWMKDLTQSSSPAYSEAATIRERSVQSRRATAIDVERNKRTLKLLRFVFRLTGRSRLI